MMVLLLVYHIISFVHFLVVFFMKKDFKAVNINIRNDLKRATNKEVDRIYKELKSLLSNFDRDSFFKNSIDYFRRFFCDKRHACLLFLNDLFDSKDKLTNNEKELLLQKLNIICDIHRSLGEDILRFLGFM